MSDKPLRNFDRFEVGHYYVYTGGKELNWTEPMNAVLNYKIHKCLDVWNKIPFSAKFKDVGGCIWNWESGFDYWVEVYNPDAVFEVGDDCLIYDKIYQHWKVADVDKKDNVFKKYIRNKKYMKFVKEKK